MDWAWWLRPVTPATKEAEAGRSQAQSLPGLQREFKAYLGNLVRPHLKIKTEKWGRGFWRQKGFLEGAA